MAQLEKKFYTLDEIAQAVGREQTEHFARDCKNDLSKWQYGIVNKTRHPTKEPKVTQA